MTVELSGLEKELLLGEGVDFASAALVASGVETREELKANLGKLDGLLRRAALGAETEGKGEVEMGRRLFSWLWMRKPRRYVPGGPFKLHLVIDAELADSRGGVGNCLGLTLLFNSLALRWGLAARAVYLLQAFGAGPHVLSTLGTGEGQSDIEHIFPYGFGYKGHKGNPRRRELSNRELLSEVYLARGNEFFEARMWERSLDMYERALLLFTGCFQARLNRGIVLAELGRASEAEECFTVFEE